MKNGEPIGEHIIVTCRVSDEDEKHVRHTLVEVRQANAAGRYVHKINQYDALLDPTFLGAGRRMTDGDGTYTLLTIKPGGYLWGINPTPGSPSIFIFRCSATVCQQPDHADVFSGRSPVCLRPHVPRCA